MITKILSIQSKLIYGYVGSNVAELAMQLHGLDPISFPTVLLSMHTGHQPIFGEAISKNLFEELVKGIETFDNLEELQYIISGYTTEEVIESTADFVRRHPDKTYICDPVMGDVEGLYIPEMTARLMIEKLIPLCHILVPNHFEIEYILGEKIRSIDHLLTMVKNHPILSGKILVITSSLLPDIPEDCIETIVIDGERVERIHSYKVNMNTTGTGDLFTSILASQLSLNNDLYSAVSRAKSYISDIMNDLLINNQPEMTAACILRHLKPLK